MADTDEERAAKSAQSQENYRTAVRLARSVEDAGVFIEDLSVAFSGGFAALSGVSLDGGDIARAGAVVGADPAVTRVSNGITLLPPTAAAEALLAHWGERGFPAAPGASEAEIAAFEGRYQIRLPPDLRAYFAMADGMADSEQYEDAPFAVFFPLGQVVPLDEIAPDNAARVLDAPGEYFAFADVNYTAKAYAVRLGGEAEGRHPVVVLDQTDYDAPKLSTVAGGFTGFVNWHLGGGDGHDS